MALYPNQPAIQDSQHVISYLSLNYWANHIAHQIQANHQFRQKPIGIICDNGSPFIAAILGVLKSGNIYVPLEPSFPKMRIKSILKDGNVKLILTDNQNQPMGQAVFGERNSSIINIETFHSLGSCENLDLDISSNSLCNIFYTSGSTRTPKGVTQTHRNILFDIRRQINDLKIHPTDRFALLFSPGFAATTSQIFCSLLSGGCVLPFDLQKSDLRQLSRWLEKKSHNHLRYRSSCLPLPYPLFRWGTRLVSPTNSSFSR